MPEPTDDAYEQEIRALAPYPSDAPWKPDVVPFLLRLLDAERARADAAEAKVARVRGFAEMSAIAAHAIGNKAEERTLLDALHLLDR